MDQNQRSAEIEHLNRRIEQIDASLAMLRQGMRALSADNKAFIRLRDLENVAERSLRELQARRVALKRDANP